MRFEDINFHERSRPAPSGLGLCLPGRYWVFKKYFEVAWRQVHANAPELDWQVIQTAETLCNEAFWQTLGVGVRIRLGRCVKYFVVHEMLPLRIANELKKGKRKYVRK